MLHNPAAQAHNIIIASHFFIVSYVLLFVFYYFYRQPLVPKRLQIACKVTENPPFAIAKGGFMLPNNC